MARAVPLPRNRLADDIANTQRIAEASLDLVAQFFFLDILWILILDSEITNLVNCTYTTCCRTNSPIHPLRFYLQLWHTI